MTNFLRKHESVIVNIVGVFVLLTGLAVAAARIQTGFHFSTSQKGLTEWVGTDLLFAAVLLVGFAAALFTRKGKRKSRS